MKWTTDKPTVAGWYWIRKYEATTDIVIAYVFFSDRQKYLCVCECDEWGGHVAHSVDKFAYFSTQPIPEPEEA